MDAPTAAAIIRYVDLRLKAYELLQQAAKLPGLPAVCKAQASAAAGLAGITFHRITIYPDAADANAVRTDLLAIARIVDPLIEAIGDQLAANFNGIDLQLFKDQVLGALEGNATHACDEAADAAREAREEVSPSIDPAAEHSTLNKAQQGGWQS